MPAGTGCGGGCAAGPAVSALVSTVGADVGVGVAGVGVMLDCSCFVSGCDGGSSEPPQRLMTTAPTKTTTESATQAAT
jgi:hypothetical protein